jgi:hypothetical protein
MAAHIRTGWLASQSAPGLRWRALALGDYVRPGWVDYNIDSLEGFRKSVKR